MATKKSTSEKPGPRNATAAKPSVSSKKPTATAKKPVAPGKKPTAAKVSPATAKPSSSSAAKTTAPQKSAAKKKRWNLRLYIAGDSPRSRTALANLRRICEERLDDDYDIEVIDLTKMPHLAKTDQILAVPTLVRSLPEPMKRLIGDLSDSDRALVALDMSK